MALTRRDSSATATASPKRKGKRRSQANVEPWTGLQSIARKGVSVTDDSNILDTESYAMIDRFFERARWVYLGGDVGDEA